MPPNDRLPPQGTASLSDILTTIQDQVRAQSSIVDAIGALSPHYTSSQLVAAKLVQTGFVRLLGYSVITGAVAGTLRDAATLALATASTGTIVGTIGTAHGFFPVNMVFAQGLVFIPGSAQIVTLFYART